jgi:hypothetical protein
VTGHGKPYANLQAQAYANVAAHSINTTGLLNVAILATQETSSSQQFWTTPFPGSTPFPLCRPWRLWHGAPDFLSAAAAATICPPAIQGDFAEVNRCAWVVV